MTTYRGHDIEMQKGRRDTWYNVVLNGVVLHRAATAHHAMQWIDRVLA